MPVDILNFAVLVSTIAFITYLNYVILSYWKLGRMEGLFYGITIYYIHNLPFVISVTLKFNQLPYVVSITCHSFSRVLYYLLNLCSKEGHRSYLTVVWE